MKHKLDVNFLCATIQLPKRNTGKQKRKYVNKNIACNIWVVV